jgi:Gnt-I system high-affinity gluconate transporter
MPLFIVIPGICLLLLLILVLKLNPFLSFIFVSVSIAIAVGMPVDKAVDSIQKGIGNTMGILIPLGFGAMPGKLVSKRRTVRKTWTVTETTIGVTGLTGVMVLSHFVK